MKLAAVIPILLLAGCATKPCPVPPPVIVPVKVAVPVVGTCVPANLPDAPAYPDTDEALKAAPDAASRYQLLGAGRPLRVQRLKELEIVVGGCPKATK